MTCLPSLLLLLAINPAGPVEGDTSAGRAVFQCTFDKSWDEDLDGWPDRWTRRSGAGFPHYVAIKISDEPAPPGNRCLRISLDGGGATAYSPPIDVGWLYGYVLDGAVKTENLVHDRAFVSVTFLDSKRRRLASHATDGVRQTDGWKRFRLGPIEPDNKDVAYAVIGLHVEPGAKEDLKGGAAFADLRLSRLPRMSLSTRSRSNVFTDPKEIEVRCHVSGFAEKTPCVAFQLEDVHGVVLARSEKPLVVRPATSGAPRLADGSSEDPSGQRGEVAWSPPTPGPGFYRVRANMSDGGATCSDAITMAVIEPGNNLAQGVFGWSLPQGDRPLPLPDLETLIAQVGIRWVKFPLWLGEKTGENKTAELVQFGERLASRGITLVGVLDQPPSDIRDRFPGKARLTAAEIFTADPKLWSPSVEAVLTRLSARVDWWQLGGDGDASFVGCAGLDNKLARIKKELDRVAGDANLGIGWNASVQPPASDGQNSPLRFVALTPETTDSAVGKGPRPSSLRRWVTLRPLTPDKHAIDARADDLVRQMMTAKIQGADAAFVSDPFDPRCGLLNDDGTPGPLLLPWRTTALALGGGHRLGGIELPGGSPNEIFVRANDAVMVVWNERPCDETLYLGEDVRQIDVWGRSVTPRKDENRQVIAVGAMPTFVVGLNKPIARWRRDFAFAKAAIPSVPGKPHANALRVASDFATEAKVRVKVVVPDGWRISPDRAQFALPPAGRRELPIEIALPYDVTNGDHPIRVDFEVDADRPYRFSVYRRLGVGLDDVKIEYQAAINAQGQLAVTQRLINATKEPVSFRCQLSAPERQRLETQIVKLPPGSSEKTYLLADGVDLVGKTLWLRAEEIGGTRKLNYRFVVKPQDATP